MTTIKRTFTHPNDRSIDEKLGLLTGMSYKPLKQVIMTEAEDKAKKQRKFAEQDLQSDLCKWIRLQYPDTYFISDFAAGMKLSPFLANIRQSQAPSMKVLDLTILERRGAYYGLILEIKTEDGTPYLKDGKTLKSSDHLRSQQESIDLLKRKGYAACFAVGLDDAMKKVKLYMELK